MEIAGSNLIGSKFEFGLNAPFTALDATTFEPIEPTFGEASEFDVATACALADEAFVPYSQTSRARRAEFLESIAQELAAVEAAIVARARIETGLPEARLVGELTRTMRQLQMFAGVLRDGAYLDIRIDEALPERTSPRPDLRLINRPIGPVAVFGASNFPLAFSVAGGDTASALAAGCPVVVKAHSAHPGTSEIAGRAIRSAIEKCDMPEGVFSLLFGEGQTVGAALVANPNIKAVGFTGSRQGGLALLEIAQNRDEPIPVYAEMSAINPCVLLHGALRKKGERIAGDFVAALTLGAGQFCTNPGLLLALDDSGTDQFVNAVRSALAGVAPATMLTPGIRQSYLSKTEALHGHERVRTAAVGQPADERTAGAHFFEVAAQAFLDDATLQQEVFGAASLLVRCNSNAELRDVLRSLEGQLTLSIHCVDEDRDEVQALLPIAEQKAGRIIFNGFGTGVEVCDAMVHGGPYPSTTDVRSTSVGSLAIKRFLRPVCYQDAPDYALENAISDENPEGVPRRINGSLVLP